MLTMLRNATKGWVAKILLGLLVLSFAIWGVSGSILNTAGSSVITVGETKVSPVEFRLAYDRQLNQLQRQLNTRLTQEQAESLGLTNRVITQLVSEAVLDETARKMKLGVSEDQLAGRIGDDEAFKDATGRFNRAQLNQILRSIGMSEQQYVDTRRSEILRSQIVSATSAQATLPDSYFDLLGQYQGEERKLNFVAIDQNDIDPIAEADEATLKSFFDENKANYKAPEFRKLAIVKLEASDIADEAAISDEEVAADYESRKESFSQAEKRTIEQLVFTDEEKASAASEKLRSGTSFAALVAEQGKTNAEITLGSLAKSEIPDAKIAQAAFDAALNTPSEPIDGLFGKVILNVSAITPGAVQPLESVSAQIRRELALSKAADAIYETHDKLEDERAAGETLTNAAKATGLTARIIEAIDPSGRNPDGDIINDIPQSRKVLLEAFQSDPGVELNPISIGTEGFVWVEVLEATPERDKEFEEVRDQVNTDWRDQQTNKAVGDLAEKLHKRLADGEEFNAVINEILPVVEGQAVRIVQQTPAIKRADTPPSGLTAQAVHTAFSQAEQSVFITDGPQAQQKLVIKIAEVNPGKSELARSVRSGSNDQVENDLLTQLISRLQQDVDTAMNQTLMRQVLTLR